MQLTIELYLASKLTTAKRARPLSGLSRNGPLPSKIYTCFRILNTCTRLADELTAMYRGYGTGGWLLKERQECIK